MMKELELSKKNFKGILLAGGKGSRLSPITKAINKHLIPILDKPMIYYSLSILMIAKIKDVLIICNEEDKINFYKLFGNGLRIGMNIEYKIQEQANGIPEAFTIAENFIKNSNVALILGDNFFYGQSLSSNLLKEKENFSGSKIFLYKVNNPSQFGVAKIKNNKIIGIKEKPKNIYSNLAITGLYFFDKNCLPFARKLKKSKRGELEIVDLLKNYLKLKKLSFNLLGRGSAWLDTGTPEGILDTSNFVSAIEKRQGMKISCLEEISFRNKWISKKELKKNFKFYKNSDYLKYLKKII